MSSRWRRSRQRRGVVEHSPATRQRCRRPRRGRRERRSASGQRDAETLFLEGRSVLPKALTLELSVGDRARGSAEGSPGRSLGRGHQSARAGVMALVWGVALLLGSCGGVYEGITPAEKRTTSMILSPDFIRPGEEAQIDAFIPIGDTGEIVNIITTDLGSGVNVIAVDTRDDVCGPIATPEGLDVEDTFRICLTLQLQDNVAPQERTATIELRVGVQPVLASQTFFILEALP